MLIVKGSKKSAIGLLLLNACTPVIQPSAPVIGAPVYNESFLTANDNAVLPLKLWKSSDNPTALIISLHGFNDYSNAFALPGEYMRVRGVNVIAYDQRGFGNTAMVGIWPGEERLVEDVRNIITSVSENYPGTPIFLMGESMGAAAAIIALAGTNTPDVKGIILVAPALWGDGAINSLYSAVLWMVAHTLPDRRFTGSDLKIQATDNIEVLRAMSRDPLVQKSARADAIYGLVGMMENAYEKISEIKVPVLLLYGKRDQVIPMDPIVSAVGQITSPCTVYYYSEGYHMLLRDLQRTRVNEDIVRWIDQVLHTDTEAGPNTGCTIHES